ncbi:hypothetical protein HOLleu_20033 [Holothuria leucospilota]|uniref:Uncharacterized protein n=1 Tax=Holothuria leucospilota TaxID=206669 RepID=A0A9Q1H847_HOLLE|nr:hypothetical protein HOLleu_20033 [Holothuria leucospilota]
MGGGWFGHRRSTVFLKRLRSRRDSVRSRGSDMKEEIGEVDQNLLNSGPKEEGTLGRQNTICEVQYAEVDEDTQTIANDNIPQKGNTSPSVCDKVVTQGHRYADNDLRGAQSYEGNNGDDLATEREKRTDEGHEPTKITGPVYQSLHPDAHSQSSYMSVSKRLQDDGYDHLETQQMNQHQTKSTSDSGYDLTKRIGKDDAKLEPSNTTESGYSLLCSSSANTTAYDKLDHTSTYDVDNVSPNQASRRGKGRCLPRK